LSVIAADEKDKPPAAMIYKPRIDYPIEARRLGITGMGMLAVEVNPAGQVKRAYILKSTGYKILDDAAIKSFSQAKFLPRTAPLVRIPFQFGGVPHSIIGRE